MLEVFILVVINVLSALNESTTLADVSPFIGLSLALTSHYFRKHHICLVKFRF